MSFGPPFLLCATSKLLPPEKSLREYIRPKFLVKSSAFCLTSISCPLTSDDSIVICLLGPTAALNKKSSIRKSYPFLLGLETSPLVAILGIMPEFHKPNHLQILTLGI